MHGRVVGVDLQRLSIGPHGAREIALIPKRVSRAEIVGVVEKPLLDALDGAGLQVDELGDVGGPVLRGEVRQHDRGRAPALLVDVREEELCVDGVGFGRKDEPLAVGRPTVPRVHPPRVRPEPSRLSSGGGDDVEFAIRLKEHEALGLAEDDPLAVGRKLGKVVAHPIVGRPFDRFRLASLAVVERDPVQVEHELPPTVDKLLRLLGRHQDRIHAAQAGRVVGLAVAAGEDDRFSVRAPGSVGLHVLWVVGPGKGVESLRLAVVDRHDPLDQEEELGKSQLRPVDGQRPILDRSHDVPPVGRSLAQEAKRLLVVFPLIIRPGDDLALVERDFLLHRQDRVRPLVVSRIDLHGQRAPVGGERMAVAADGQLFQNDRRWLFARHLAKTPADMRRRILDCREEREVHFPKEQGRAHLVVRRAD